MAGNVFHNNRNTVRLLYGLKDNAPNLSQNATKHKPSKADKKKIKSKIH